MKAINKFAMFIFTAVSLASIAAHAEEGDEFKFYGRVDAGMMLTPKAVSLTNAGQQATFAGATGSKKIPGKQLVIGAKAEASIALDTGVGTASNLQNTTDTGAPACSVKGATGASCTVTPNGSQGVVFSRELIAFARGKDEFGNAHELRAGRGYVPTYSNLQDAKLYFGETGVGSPLALATLYQGITSIRASKMVSYRLTHRELSFTLTGALSDRKFWGPGDLLGFRSEFKHGGLHLGLAGQYTKAVEGDVGIANLSASYAFERLTLTAFGQFTGRRSGGSGGALLARFGHLEGDLNLSKKLTVMASAEWLEVRDSNDDAGQFAAGVLWKFPREITAYAKAAYIVNQGKATAHPTGTATVGAGEDNEAAIIGAMMSF